MTQNFKTVLNEVELETSGELDKLIKTTSISLDESRLFFSIQLKIFKEMKADHMTDKEKPSYNIFSIDKSFANNYLGLEELEKAEAQFNTEQDVREYLNV